MSSDRPTVKDVAVAAGVSPKTVSRVLNGGANVRPEKTERVLAAVKDLGFQRNEMARLLRTQGAADMVGVITGATDDPFWSGMIGGLERSIGEHRFVLSAATGEDADNESSTALAMLERRVMALVLVPVAKNQSYLKPAVASGLPVVCVDRPARGIEVDTVLGSDFLAARKGTELLIEAGHRHIGFMSRPSRYTAATRRRGYRSALKAAGIEHRPELDFPRIISDDDIDQAFKALRAAKPAATAIFSSNVAVTLGCLAASAAHDWHPGLLAFSEFDASALVSPPVTVIDNNPSELGIRAAELVQRRLEGDDSPPQLIHLDSSLIVRQSHLQFP